MHFAGSLARITGREEQLGRVQVDSLLPEHLGDLLVLDPPAVEGVVGAVVLVCGPRHAELGVGHHLGLLAAPVDDLLEVDGDPAPVLVGVSAGVVNQNRKLLRPGERKSKEN